MKFPHTLLWLLLAAPALLLAPAHSPAKPRDKGTHWAYRPLLRPEVDRNSGKGWARNSIDLFIAAKLEAQGLAPTPAASRSTLIRRVTFDLTGLPPTPEEIEAFERSTRPDAWAEWIDHLLASPAYGERWAQHWLDIARFAETDGFEHDLVRPNAWRYRDWVIEALNADMPYDAFVRMQIAGDEIAIAHAGHDTNPTRQRGPTDTNPTRQRGPMDAGASSASPAVATGFLLCGPDMPDINLQDERRHVVLNEMTATVGSVFLGLQFGCAQCHDHKFDPISMADFYRLRAFFDPADFFDEAPLATPAELAERERLEAPIKSERDRIEKELKTFDATAHERLNKDPQVKISRDELVSALSESEREQFQRLSDELKRISTGNMPALPVGRVLREKGGTPRPSHVMLRGDFRQPGPRVTPAFPAIANPVNAPVNIDESVTPSSGRRTALARWLTQPDHPLTTRVIVNRVWQFHFGHGLVRTSSDFGKMGEPPSHPELLDWLATEFTRPAEEGGCGWSLKRLHKLMLTSATYMQASRPDDTPVGPNDGRAAGANWKRLRERDPENRLLGHMNRLRLDGESIRDAMLAVSENLSPRRGGPGVRPPLPDELTSTLLKGQWTVTPDTEDHRRRSIYIFVRRNLRYPLFEVFDRPDTNASCPERPRSTTAPQSLMLLNSELSFNAARELARVSWAQNGAEPRANIDACYQRALGRRPTADELETGVTFIRDQSDRLRREARDRNTPAAPRGIPENADPSEFAALADFCLAVLNLNEFVYLD
jgi:hypothetical protein